MSIFFAKLFGFYLIIASLYLFFRQKLLIHVVHDLVKSKGMRYFVGFSIVAAGLALILGHNIWVGGFVPIVVTVFGWLMLAKGLSYLFLAEKQFSNLLKWFEKNSNLVPVFALFYGIFGAYLLYLAYIV